MTPWGSASQMTPAAHSYLAETEITPRYVDDFIFIGILWAFIGTFSRFIGTIAVSIPKKTTQSQWMSRLKISRSQKMRGVLGASIMN